MTFALQAFRATPEASSTQNTRLRRAKAVEASPQYVQDLLSRMHPVWDRILASGLCPRTGFLTLMQILADEIFNCSEAAAGLSWTQGHERIESLEKLKRTGARRHFDKLISGGLLAKNGDGCTPVQCEYDARSSNDANYDAGALMRRKHHARCSAYMDRRVSASLRRYPHPPQRADLNTKQRVRVPRGLTVEERRRFLQRISTTWLA